jgi:Conserved TM helix
MSMLWQEAMLEAFRETTMRMAHLLPKILALLTFLALGLAVGWLVKVFLLRVLRAFRFDALCERFGLGSSLAKAGTMQSASNLVGRLAFWVVFLLFAVMGIDALDLTATANMMNAIIGFLPHMLAALLLLFFGILLANFIAEATLIATVNAQIQEARTIATFIRWGVLIFTVAMVLTQLGIAKEIVVSAFSITFGGVVLALAIAVGLGGQSIAKDVLEERFHRRKVEQDEMSHI